MSSDWTTGPAKWAAVAVLGCASIFGMTWSILTRGPASPAAQPSAIHPSPEPPTPTQADLGAPAPAPSASVGRRININTAPSADLELLPGIGPALAARIIEYRKTSGPFRSVDDLDKVKGIGPRTLVKIRP